MYHLQSACPNTVEWEQQAPLTTITTYTTYTHTHIYINPMVRHHGKETKREGEKKIENQK